MEVERRSFFLFVITVRNSPCNFKGDVNCPAKKREQKHDLFKRHGASPLSALKQSGENEIPNEKIRSYPATQGTGKEHSCSGADRRLRRKQGGEAGAAASETRVPPKERSGCWEPQPVLRLFCKLQCFSIVYTCWQRTIKTVAIFEQVVYNNSDRTPRTSHASDVSHGETFFYRNSAC